MASTDIGQVVKNIDRRLANVEQILPTLATKAELDAAIANAIAPLATKAELSEEGVRTRRHFDVVAEGLKENLKAIADGHAALTQQLVDMKAAHDGDIARLDARVTRLKARR